MSIIRKFTRKINGEIRDITVIRYRLKYVAGVAKSRKDREFSITGSVQPARLNREELQLYADALPRNLDRLMLYTDVPIQIHNNQIEQIADDIVIDGIYYSPIYTENWQHLNSVSHYATLIGRQDEQPSDH